MSHSAHNVQKKSANLPVLCRERMGICTIALTLSSKRGTAGGTALPVCLRFSLNGGRFYYLLGDSWTVGEFAAICTARKGLRRHETFTRNDLYCAKQEEYREAFTTCVARIRELALQSTLTLDRIAAALTGKSDLSFGNRKKVGIVCALQHNPELLVLDEPTGGLDPLMQHEFFSILQERNQEGVTVFLSSHVLSEIQRYCSKAAIIREGKIIACDSVDRLVKTGARRVTFRGNLQPDALPDIRDWTESDGIVSFLYNGETNKLIRTLSGLDVHELTVTEPDLEEIVLHFYEKGGDQA